jgi:uncharacterized protein with PQ loop repeat
MLEIIGWVGAICFAICGLPQARLSFKQKHSLGVSGGFLALWFTGEVLTIIYVLPKKDWPLLFNYSCNLVFLCVIIWYWFFPKLTSNKN